MRPWSAAALSVDHVRRAEIRSGTNRDRFRDVANTFLRGKLPGQLGDQQCPACQGRCAFLLQKRSVGVHAVGGLAVFLRGGAMRNRESKPAVRMLPAPAATSAAFDITVDDRGTCTLQPCAAMVESSSRPACGSLLEGGEHLGSHRERVMGVEFHHRIAVGGRVEARSARYSPTSGRVQRMPTLRAE